MIRFLSFLLFVALFILTSCRPSQKEYTESFDIPLVMKNAGYFALGEYDSIMNLNTVFLEKADRMHYKEGKALCYINLGNVSMVIENYSQAQTFFELAEKILKNSENNLRKAKLYTDYSSLYMKIARFNKAFECNELALEYISKADESPLKNDILSRIYLNQADNHIERRQYALASKYLYKARIFDNSGYVDCRIGDFNLYENNNRDSAYFYISRIYKRVHEEKRMDKVALYANTIMGEYYLMNKEFDEAESSLKNALKVDAKTRRLFAYYTKYIYNDLRWMYERKRDYEKAYFYLTAYIKAKNETNALKRSAMNQDMNSFIVEAEENTQKVRNNILALILIGTAVFTFSGIYSWKAITGLRKKKIKLKNEAEGLKDQMDNTVGEKAIKLAQTNDPSFLQVFREAYPGFTEKVLEINPDLEDSELVFCAMLKLHFSSKEIAGFTSVQHRTVQQKKYRIRKKLNIPQDTDTYLFFDHLLSSNY